MIKANEIRKGNYFNVPNKIQCPFRIDLIEHLSNEFGKFGQINNPVEHPLTWYLKDLKPILLTEQWLIDFGFKLIEMGTINYYSKGLIKDNDFNIEMYVYYHFRDSKIVEFGIATNEGETRYSMITELAYSLDISEVHKLQNLYFALTGEELTLNNLHNK